MKKKGNIFVLGCAIIYLLISLIACPVDPIIYTVIFDTDDVSTVEYQSIQENTQAARPSINPTKNGYTFDNWYADNTFENEWDFNTPINNDTRIYAKWIGDSYTVSFDSQGATTVADPESKTVTLPATTIDELPTAPLKTGYTFDGWYTAEEGAGSEFTASTVVTETITVYAKWNYMVGGPGQTGGYVFYDKGSYSDGWRYLEAATASNEWTNKVWGGYGTIVGGTATATAIGTGESNTEIIVSAFGYAEPYEGKSDYAAKLCADLVVSKDGVEYDDWFLPSKDELNLMYENLKRNNLGGFSDLYYWSSSEYDALIACYQYFLNGYQIIDYRYSNNRVRPVRAF